MSGKPSWWDDAMDEIAPILKDFHRSLREGIRNATESELRKKVREAPRFRIAVLGRSTPREVAETIAESWVLASTATKLGTAMEGVAQILSRYYAAERGGISIKSGAKGVDMETEVDGKRRFWQLTTNHQTKSGSSASGLKKELKQAVRIAKQGNKDKVIVAAYGRYDKRDRKNTTKDPEEYEGKYFWEEITGWSGARDALTEEVAKGGRNGLSEERMEAARKLERIILDNQPKQTGLDLEDKDE